MIISDGRVPRTAMVKTVAAPFRSNEQIVGLLEHITAQPHFPDELTLRRALNILDDLAEEIDRLLDIVGEVTQYPCHLAHALGGGGQLPSGVAGILARRGRLLS